MDGGTTCGNGGGLESGVDPRGCCCCCCVRLLFVFVLLLVGEDMDVFELTLDGSGRTVDIVVEGTVITGGRELESYYNRGRAKDAILE